VFLSAPRRSSWHPGVPDVEVDDIRDGSWICCFAVLLYLAAKPTHVGVDVDELACPLHHPMAYGHQTRGQGLLRDDVLSCPVIVVGQWRLSRGCEAPGLDIWWSIDHVDTCVAESYME
jgi:hypothetical protein